MANLFGGQDLFGNKANIPANSNPTWQDAWQNLFGNRPQQIPANFNPKWQDVWTGVVDVGGNVVGQVPLDRYHYADKATADQLAQILPGATVTSSQSVGPGANPTPQYALNFGDPNHNLNAGLVAKTLEYATKGRYNADTGQYEKENPDAVMARIMADARPPLYWQQQGQANPFIPNPAGTMAIPGAYSGGAGAGGVGNGSGGMGSGSGTGGGVPNSGGGASRPSGYQQSQQTTQQSQQAAAARRAALAEYLRNKLYTGNNLGNMSSYRAGQGQQGQRP